MDLQYWLNGEPVLEDSSSSMKEMEYWLNGEPYIYIADEATSSNNAVMFGCNF